MNSNNQVKTTTVHGHRVDDKRMAFETSAGNEFIVGEDASPGEYMLGSVAACYNLIGHMVAEEMGLNIQDLHVSVAGDIDPRKYKGDPTDSRAGYQELRVAIDIDANADSATLDAWLTAVQDRCPVCDNVVTATATTTIIS
ncbi:OsmC family protein [Haladaptatus sp. DFWS20]|uniref:OsmC family protein n=1 Tax=Haladaptatus sp. DFWS20 TaxID=3403467 RepID=UPI003EC0B66C